MIVPGAPLMGFAKVLQKFKVPSIFGVENSPLKIVVTYKNDNRTHKLHLSYRFLFRV